jgi:hypothetical protein
MGMDGKLEAAVEAKLKHEMWVRKNGKARRVNKQICRTLLNRREHWARGERGLGKWTVTT